MRNDINRKKYVPLNTNNLSRHGEEMNRREFLKRAGCAGAGLALAAIHRQASAQPVGELQKRILGRTKEKVTILGLGTPWYCPGWRRSR
jgi:hypothetical protein